MAANHDEAMRCVGKATAALHEGDTPRAERLVAKAERMHPGLGAAAALRARMQQSPTGAGAGKTKPAPTPKEAPKEEEDDAPTRAATPEMVADVAAVKRARGDLYAVLGVGRDASGADVKRAYRRAVLKLHPDKNVAPGAEEAFKTVARAWETLSDPARRRRYDVTGVADDEPQQPQVRRRTRTAAGGPGVRMYAQGGDVDIDELFNMMFNQGRGGTDPFGAHFDVHRRRQRHHYQRRNNVVHHEVNPVFALLWVFGLLGTFSAISFALQVLANVLGV